MITITKLIEVSGVAPYQVFVNTIGEASVEEVTPTIYRITILYNEDIGTGDTVTVIDDLGCIRSLPLQITNVCDELFVSQIVRLSGPGNPGQTTTTTPSTYEIQSNQEVTIEWTLDRPELYQVEELGSQITLTQIATDSSLTTTNLRAIVTNINGCTQTRRFQLSPCATRAYNSQTILPLVEENLYRRIRVPLSASSSCGLVDWSTLDLINNTSVSVVQQPGLPYVDVESQTSINANIFFSVADESGSRSNIARLKVLSQDQFTPDPNGVEGNVEENINNQIPGIVFDDDINDLLYPLNELGINNPNGISINSTLTTANSASITSNNLSLNVTGQQTVSVGLNIPQQSPTVITFIRDLSAYNPNFITLDVPCTNNGFIDLTNQSGIVTANSIVSGEGTLTNNQLTTSEDDQVIKVNVTNNNGQTSVVDVYACRTCGASFTKTTCESEVILFNLINAPSGGTWTSTNGPVPTTHNGSVTLANGSYNYTYQITNPVTQCSSTIDYTLNLTKEASNNVANNSCATSEQLIPITSGDSTQSFTNKTISSSCDSKTTWSGNKGLMSTTLYDQWFVYNINGQGNPLKQTITVRGIGNNPVQIPGVQIWNTCTQTLTNVTYSQSGNTVTAVFTDAGNGTAPVYIQVLSDTTGNYRLEVLQETI